MGPFCLQLPTSLPSRSLLLMFNEPASGSPPAGSVSLGDGKRRWEAGVFSKRANERFLAQSAADGVLARHRQCARGNPRHHFTGDRTARGQKAGGRGKEQTSASRNAKVSRRAASIAESIGVSAPTVERVNRVERQAPEEAHRECRDHRRGRRVHGRSS